ncbi:MAG: DUF748 domain-containing protein, partial [Candidatus Omnitrophica bacterium]|nr:DUF748 domain-containing protein [Candidatus Omnitrophota bacterium]
MKKFFLALFILILLAAGAVYVFRHQIIEYSAQSIESIIKQKLPDYVYVDRLHFDYKNNRLEIRGLAIKNPPGYRNEYLATVDIVVCDYRMRGANILDGIEVTKIVATGPVINIERDSAGRLNVNEMAEVMNPGGGRRLINDGGAKESIVSYVKDRTQINSLSDIVKLTERINIVGGKLILLDSFITRPAYRVTYEDMNGVLDLKLSDDYRKVVFVKSRGDGLVEGKPSQQVKWDIALDPTARDLTMQSSFDVSNIDIRLFEPYYDMYSPVIIDRGRCSGTLVFNFDNGAINSSNTLYLNDFVYREKEGSLGAQYWNVGISEVVRYLKSSSGEIVFDFKITGDMKNPKIYP